MSDCARLRREGWTRYRTPIGSRPATDTHTLLRSSDALTYNFCVSLLVPMCVREPTSSSEKYPSSRHIQLCLYFALFLCNTIIKPFFRTFLFFTWLFFDNSFVRDDSSTFKCNRSACYFLVLKHCCWDLLVRRCVLLVRIFSFQSRSVAIFYRTVWPVLEAQKVQKKFSRCELRWVLNRRLSKNLYRFCHFRNRFASQKPRVILVFLNFWSRAPVVNVKKYFSNLLWSCHDRKTS